MPAPNDPPPLVATELLYRRVPVNPQFYDPSGQVILEEAFKPSPSDIDGLSLSRECVGPAGAAATGLAGRDFYVATLRAADLVAGLGLDVVADRDDHAVIRDLTYPRRRSKDPAVRDRLSAIYIQLVAAVIDVSGPFPGKARPPSPPGAGPTAPPSPA